MGARRCPAGCARQRGAETVGRDAAVAVQAARTAPGQIATLILPADTAWDAGGVVAEALPVPGARRLRPMLCAARPWCCGVGRRHCCCWAAMRCARLPLRLAYRIAAATGATLMAMGSNGRVARGRGRVPINRIPYPADQAVAALASFRHVILVNARKPVIFFAYPGKPGSPVADDATEHATYTAGAGRRGGVEVAGGGGGGGGDGHPGSGLGPNPQGERRRRRRSHVRSRLCCPRMRWLPMKR